MNIMKYFIQEMGFPLFNFERLLEEDETHQLKHTQETEGTVFSNVVHKNLPFQVLGEDGEFEIHLRVNIEELGYEREEQAEYHLKQCIPVNGMLEFGMGITIDDDHLILMVPRSDALLTLVSLLDRD